MNQGRTDSFKSALETLSPVPSPHRGDCGQIFASALLLPPVPTGDGFAHTFTPTHSVCVFHKSIWGPTCLVRPFSQCYILTCSLQNVVLNTVSYVLLQDILEGILLVYKENMGDKKKIMVREGRTSVKEGYCLEVYFHIKIKLSLKILQPVFL